MKLFIAFAYPVYYPGGPKSDFIGAFSTMEDAKQSILPKLGFDGRGDGSEYGVIYDVEAEQWVDFPE